MKKIFLSLLLCTSLTVSAQTQVANGDFETWTYDGINLPNNWNSFQTAGGQYVSLGYSKNNRQVRQSAEVRPGSTGQNSVVIWARSVIGVVAQGNLTSGRVNAGATSPTGAENYNWSDRQGVSTNGDATNPCAMKFTGRPDSVVVWTKFVPASILTDAPFAKFSAIIHGDYDYISYGLASNDTEENKAQVVASVESNIESLEGQWQRISAPFVYTHNEVTPAYVILNFSTNAYPGKGTKNDSLYVDDIEMVYNSELASLLYNRKKVVLDENNTATLNGSYDEAKLAYTLTGVSAAADLSFNDEDNTLVITVKGADVEANPNNQHVYTIQFVPQEECENPYMAVEYPEDELAESLPVDPFFFASRENPIDMTGLIANGDMQQGQTGWTITSNKSKFTSGGAEGALNGEFYNDSYSDGLWGLFADDTSFDFNQTITDIPNGIYKVTVQAYNRPGDMEKITGNEVVGVLLYANDSISTPIHHIVDDASAECMFTAEGGDAWMTDFAFGEQFVPNSQKGASVYFQAGRYVNELEVEVTDGTLKFGLKKDKDKLAKQWTCFDNFTLQYLGVTGETIVPVPAVLDVVWPETLTSTVVREQTTDTLTIAFDYADGTPSEGWRYAYLELVQNDTTVLMGCCALDAELLQFKTQVPNMLQTGECELVVRIGNGQTKASVPFYLTTYEQSYPLTFVVDGETYLEDQLAVGAEVVYPDVEEREGYTFAWDKQIDSMPPSAETVIGTFEPKTYRVTYKDGDTVIATYEVKCGDAMPETPAYNPEGDDRYTLTFTGWSGEAYETMPAHDVEYAALVDVVDGIAGVAGQSKSDVYDLQGRRVIGKVKGVYIEKGKKMLKK